MISERSHDTEDWLLKIQLYITGINYSLTSIRESFQFFDQMSAA